MLFGGCASSPAPRHSHVDTTTTYADDIDEPEPEDESEPFIIRSPFGKHLRMDLTGMKPGTKVEDPYTGGIFKVPASKDEDPEIVSEPPENWQPEN